MFLVIRGGENLDRESSQECKLLLHMKTRRVVSGLSENGFQCSIESAPLKAWAQKGAHLLCMLRFAWVGA